MLTHLTPEPRCSGLGFVAEGVKIGVLTHGGLGLWPMGLLCIRGGSTKDVRNFFGSIPKFCSTSWPNPKHAVNFWELPPKTSQNRKKK